jgi:hypothetical protein
MHGPTCIVWANLTTFSLEAVLADPGAYGAVFGRYDVHHVQHMDDDEVPRWGSVALSFQKRGTEIC